MIVITVLGIVFFLLIIIVAFISYKMGKSQGISQSIAISKENEMILKQITDVKDNANRQVELAKEEIKTTILKEISKDIQINIDLIKSEFFKQINETKQEVFEQIEQIKHKTNPTIDKNRNETDKEVTGTKSVAQENLKVFKAENYVSYLYSAFINKIPLIIFGEKSRQIAVKFANIIDDKPFIIDCNNDIEIDTLNMVIIIDNLIESKKLVDVTELLEKRDKFYIIAIPDYNAAKSLPYSFYNYALPVLSDYIIDESGSNYDSNRKVINGYLEFEPCDENKLKLSNQIKDLLNDLRVSKLTQWLYLKLLSEAHLINNQLTEKEDLLFILLSFANVTNKIENFSNFIILNYNKQQILNDVQTIINPRFI